MIDEKEIEFLQGIYNPRTRLNNTESDEALLLLIERHGAICVFCKKPAWQLMIEDNAIRELKGLPQRKRPILVVHEIYRGIFHSTVLKNNIPIEIKYGGCRPACYSCNQRKKTLEPKSIDKKTMTWQAKKSIVRDQFRQLVEIAIAKKIHICKKLAVNVYSGQEYLHCSQEVLEESVKQNIGTRWDIIDITDFNIKCEYCERYYGDNQHIIWKGKPPVRMDTDIDKMLKETE